MSYVFLSFSDVEEIPNEDEEAMMKMMGFSNFDSTKVVVIFNTPVVLTKYLIGSNLDYLDLWVLGLKVWIMESAVSWKYEYNVRR